MTRPESYDELIRTEIRKMRPTKAYPYDPDFPYAVLNVFSDEGIARFRYESDAADFAYEDLTLYVIDTTPKERPMTDQTPAELIAEARTHVTDEYITPDTSAEETLIRRLASALEASEKRATYPEAERSFLSAEWERIAKSQRQTINRLEQERDQYAAVVEKAEDFVTRHYLDTRFGDEVLPILATAPADALREKARKRREEKNRG